ncbi:MAG: hypothetical protein L0H63_14920, partial [Nitrococcus sp.]|nr:hypothetical protein [Nitrococcus sp.]
LQLPVVLAESTQRLPTAPHQRVIDDAARLDTASIMRRRRLQTQRPLGSKLVPNRLDRRHNPERTERMDRRAALRIRAWSQEECSDADRVTEEKPNEYEERNIQHKKSLSLCVYSARTLQPPAYPSENASILVVYRGSRFKF